MTCDIERPRIASTTGGTTRKETPDMAKPRPSALDRFHTKYVAAESDCWHWNASVDPRGYGRFSVKGKVVYAHRFAYEQFVGPIPDGLVIDHLCRNRACVNPDHLRACTSSDNMHAPNSEALPALNALKTHCSQDHEFNDANTYIYRGNRYCRDCRRHRNAQSKRRRLARRLAEASA